MKFLSKAKDGGPESTVTGYWLVEIKKLFSVVLLKFEDGSRDAYHSHAFNSLNWVLSGRVVEDLMHSNGVSIPGGHRREHVPSALPVITRRDDLHQVKSEGTTWVLSLRGPWADTWLEWIPNKHKWQKLTHGRRIIKEWV